MKSMRYPKFCRMALAMGVWGFFFMLFCDAKEQEGKKWAVLMADSIMKRQPLGYGVWDYVTGTVLWSMAELWRTTGEQRYFDYIQKTVDAVVDEDGTIHNYRMEDYNLDEINEGRLLLFLYENTGLEKYKKAARILRQQIQQQPRTQSGGFWHKKRYPWQMWLDGIYMGCPFYSHYSRLFAEKENFDDIIHQILLIEQHTRDPHTGLLYHGWDESRQQTWADSSTGRSASVWARAVGWYAMALVDVLDYLPLDHSGRDSVIQTLQRLASAIARYQDPKTGLWWQVMDRGGEQGNYLESSASCMFVYALAKAARQQYIDLSYRKVAQRGFHGILKHFISYNDDGTINLEKICETAGLGYGRDGSYDYYVNQTKIVRNDGKGLGPFILACLEF